ncbi:MAG: hypothetical protein WC375_08160 [Methanomassiliicoccales archaeon]|jgi:hypothetical protein
MAKRTQRRKAGGLVLAALLIVLALSIILVSLTDVSWIIIPAAVFLTLGIMYVLFGVIYMGSEPLDYYFGPKQSSYSLGWGIILTFIGLVMLNVWVFEGVSVTIMFAVLLLVLGLISLFRFMSSGKKGGA